VSARIRRRLPRAALACALVALANGLAWSLIVPPFQVPDENAHYAYVQQLVERGSLPHVISHEGSLSLREDSLLSALLTYGIAGHARNPVPYTEAQQQVIEAAVNANLPARGSGDVLSATNNPPLYYALQSIPYRLTPSGKVLDRLTAMRVLSALLSAITVLLIFLFLRELLPGRPWGWSAGALVAAFQPLFGFISGGVNNDVLLYLLATGVLLALARAFRRGLGPATGALLGVFLGLGLITKLTMLGFVPAVVLAVALLLRRAWKSPERPRALRGGGLALGAPIAIYLFLSEVVWRRGAIAAGHAFHFRDELSHVWQLFLPRLWMRPQFSYQPLWETWFKGFFGRLGWLDYAFPAWVYYFALAVSLVVVGLAVAELARSRLALGRRLGELAVYVLVMVGLCAEIGVQSYRFLIFSGGQFEQARYLLSGIGLYAAIAALAVRFGGRRWGPAMAAALVLLAIGHDLFAQALTIARYYA